MEGENWETFFQENPPPPNIADVKSAIMSFCKKQHCKGVHVVLVTSGGTTVPLEHNTVRFVDNFSAGTRGAASTEYFLKAGYAVIFLHRTKSLEPFMRHASASELLRSLKPAQDCEGNWKIEVQTEYVPKLLPVLQQYHKVHSSGRLLELTFTTLLEYLHYLYVAANALRPLKNIAMLYLAAAVSDFYIPPIDMATHKISSDSPLHVNFHLVPKTLKPLVRYWVPDAFVVSFKLETNDDVLISKAQCALDKYGHKLVVANLLHERKRKVVLITKDEIKPVVLTDEEAANGKEIEDKIVSELICYHQAFMST